MENYLDPNDFYSEVLDSWRELWDSELSLYENISSIINDAVRLPGKSIFLPIAATYCLIPSKWAKCVPILFSYGEEGSGKSSIAYIASKIHGTNCFSAADTFASLRNSLDTMRWIDLETKTFEKEGVMMCWDNLHIDVLKYDQKLYQLLLLGYSRQTEKMQIAGKEGQNLSYHVFCPKIISSVEPIHLVPEFRELKRRLLIVPHKKWERFSVEERVEFPTEFSERLDPDSIDWNGLNDEYLSFWGEEDRCRRYVGYRHLFSSRTGRKSLQVPEIIDTHRWNISIDLLCTGLVVGTWASPQEAIIAVSKYWEFQVKKEQEDSLASRKLIEDFIEEEVGSLIRINEKLIAANQQPAKVIIPAIKLRKFLDQCEIEGRLEEKLTQKQRVELMFQIGWTLSKEGWVQR